MGGRGTLGTRDFTHTTKASVVDALKKKNIQLMKDGKPVDASSITNKELATLSALAEVVPKGTQVVDITNSRSEKPLHALKVKYSKTGEFVNTVYVSKSMSKRGYKYMNKAVESEGHKGGIKGYSVGTKKSTGVPTKPKPKAKLTEAEAIKRINKIMGL